MTPRNQPRTMFLKGRRKRQAPMNHRPSERIAAAQRAQAMVGALSATIQGLFAAMVPPNTTPHPTGDNIVRH